MPSYNDIWIPTLAVAVVLGITFLLYALENLNGTVSGLVRVVKWYCGCYKSDLATATSDGPSVARDTLPERKKKKKKKSKKDKKGKTGKKRDDSVSASVPEPESDDALPQPVDLSWEDVTFTVQPGGPETAKKLLQPSSGSFFPCEAVAIMGPSGAGKSTLLDVLSGRKTGKGVSGTVTLNGMPITPQLSNMYTAYVGQEDVFVPTLSVWESLSFITQLCMGPLSIRDRHSRMERVLETMGLLRVKNSKVGGFMPGDVAVRGLSGGERRRLSIACGLIGNPPLMFLDEPTTGLDSFAALAVMKYLNALTNRGHTIVSSIHQPRQEIFVSFDKVLILSEGYLLYLAPPSFVVPWFSQVLGFPYDKTCDGTVADWLIGITAVGFRKGGKSKSRSMASEEEVKQAAEKFIESAKVVREAEEAATSVLSTEDPDETRSWVDLTPAASIADGTQYPSNASVLSGSAFGGSVAGLLGANGYSHEQPGTPQGQEAVTITLDEVHAEKQFSRSWLFQVWMLTRRSVMHQLRNPAEAATRILFAAISGIIPGLVWIRLPDSPASAQQRVALIFFVIVMFCMTPFAYMAFPLADKRFFILDSQRGLYMPSAYFAGYMISNVPFFLINGYAGTLVTYGLVGLRYEGWAIMQYSSILGLTGLVTNQMITMLIWLCNSQDLAFSISTIYISFSLLLCGFYIRVRDMELSVVRALTWASFSKYAFNAMATVELKDRVWTDNSCPLQTEESGFTELNPCSDPSFVQDYFVLDSYDFPLTVAECCGALLGFFGLFCILSYFALLRLYKKP